MPHLGFRVIAVIAMFGGALQTGAANQALVSYASPILMASSDMQQYIVVRFITAFATGQAFAAMPVYFAEVAPTHSRGLLAGAHGCFINVGYAASNWIGWGFPNIYSQ